MLEASVLQKVTDMISDFIKTQGLPNTTYKLTHDRYRRSLPVEVQDNLVRLQEVLTSHLHTPCDVSKFVKYANSKGVPVRATREPPDTWGLTSFYLHTPKGAIWFG